MSVKSIKDLCFRVGAGDFAVWDKQVLSKQKSAVKWKEWIEQLILCFECRVLIVDLVLEVV